ncbi:ABC transporter permease [Candidatus Acetothermia bacterium]|nr:ABC transporter permease [Candidatus Acetothermia bacterium]MCI2427669.1 ABC transporter permease [Candidatus Acetothermia bacterium]MCI2429003.1 ABC transporter permease [Candidatus Acetothermia bacterium]
MIKDFFFLALKTVRQRRLRSWLTVIGVVIGITAVVALLSLGIGLERTIIAQVEGIFGVDTIMIMRGVEERDPRRDTRRGPVPGLIDIEPDLVRQVEEVVAIAPIRSETGLIRRVAENGVPVSGFFPVIGLYSEMVTEFRAFIGEFPIAAGRMLIVGDERKAILGYAVAQRLAVTPGKTIEIEGQSFQVVGIIETYPEEMKAAMGAAAGLEPILTDETIFIPFAMMEEIFGDAGAPLFLAKAGEREDVVIVAERINTALAEAGVDGILLVTFEEISQGIGTMVNIVSSFVAGLAGIALLVGGVGLMNTMYTSVLERTREIGVMKAVGAQNRHILSIFLIESSLMGFIGGIVGIILGLLLSVGASLAMRHFWEFELLLGISAPLIIGALLFSLLVGAIAGMLPARRASKLRPVEAFRYE